MIIRNRVPEPRELRTRSRFILYGTFHTYQSYILHDYDHGDFDREWVGQEKVTVICQTVTVTEEYWRGSGWHTRQILN